MPVDNALFTAADLTGLVHRPVTEDEAAAAERVVWGRIKPLLQLDVRPAQISDELVGAVLELGVLVYTNPDALLEYILEGERSNYDLGRRDEILRTIASGGTTAPGAPPRARGSFPRACPYPDPAAGGGFGRDLGLL